MQACAGGEAAQPKGNKRESKDLAELKMPSPQRMISFNFDLHEHQP